MPTGPRLHLPFEARQLRLWRERRGLLQVTLARLCTEQGTPVSRFQVIRAETGRHMPQPHVLIAFAKALEIDVEALFVQDETAPSCIWRRRHLLQDPDRVYRQRIRAGLTQQQLADRSGLAQSTVSHIENGIVAAPSETLALLARAMGCDVEDLTCHTHDTPARRSPIRGSPLSDTLTTKNP